jgi:OOP family OmpA-OmpF porin
MRTRFSPWIVVVALAIPSGIVSASPQGNFRWITPMVGWGQFSNSLRYPDKDSLEDAPLAGLRLGMQLNEFWGFELAGSGAMTKEAAGPKRDVTYYNASGNFMYTPVVWNAGSFYLAAGGGASQHKAKDLPGRPFGTFEQAIGWTGWFSDHSGYRLEARNILNIPKRNWGNADKAHQQYWLGLTWAMGGKPVDTDGDGVPDRKDKCPGTPAGATVDATGCPHDSDGDGVWDGLDKCPNTPKGARVDANGCPTDGDGDGVPDGIDQCADTPKGATVDA